MYTNLNKSLFKAIVLHDQVGGAGALLWISKASFLTNSLAPFFIKRDMAYDHHSIGRTLKM